VVSVVNSHVLAVVENQQRLSLAQVCGQRRQQRAPGILAQIQHRSDRRDDQRRVNQWR